MPRRGNAKKPRAKKSEEEETYKQRYWMCDNYEFDPPLRANRIGLLEPGLLCDSEQWINNEISEQHKQQLRRMKEWEEEQKELLEKRRKEEAAEKEHKKEEQRRLAAQCREEREKKLERAHRAKAAMEKNPDAFSKGKWPRCTQ